MSKVYLVKGFSGEYSDVSQWIAAAFLDEDKAKDYLVRVQEIADRIKSEDSDEENELDSGMSDRGNGVDYSLHDVELR
jgi:hypothetical protein